MRNPRALGVLLALVLPRGAPTSFSVVEGAPRPPGVSAAVDRALSAAPIDVIENGRRAASFWIRREIPSEPRDGGRSPVLEDNVAIPGIEAGSLVAAVRFERPWRDYRDREVPPGSYTLRYLRQPAIKEHKGVSRYRDFLLLVPAALDRELPADPAEIARRSADAFGSGHPTVMAIFPAARSARPRIEPNERGEPMAVIVAGAFSMGLVLEGHGDSSAPR
jgi:hypothetical protein